MSDRYKELIKKYPDLFGIEGKPAPYNERSVECGEGWYDLIDNLCAIVQSEVNQNEKVGPVRIQQIKEKFGTLRFYISGYSDYIRGAIIMAEQLSKYICEECGEKGTIQPDMGWIKTLCHECYHEWENIRAGKWSKQKPIDAAIEEEYEDEVELYKTYGGD